MFCSPPEETRENLENIKIELREGFALIEGANFWLSVTRVLEDIEHNL